MFVFFGPDPGQKRVLRFSFFIYRNPMMIVLFRRGGQSDSPPCPWWDMVDWLLKGDWLDLCQWPSGPCGRSAMVWSVRAPDSPPGHRDPSLRPARPPSGMPATAAVPRPPAGAPPGPAPGRPGHPADVLEPHPGRGRVPMPLVFALKPPQMRKCTLASLSMPYRNVPFRKS